MERSVLSANNRVAAELHDALDASKTARLEETLKLLPHSTQATVLTGDIQTDMPPRTAGSRAASLSAPRFSECSRRAKCRQPGGRAPERPVPWLPSVRRYRKMDLASLALFRLPARQRRQRMKSRVSGRSTAPGTLRAGIGALTPSANDPEPRRKSGNEYPVTGFPDFQGRADMSRNFAGVRLV